MPDPIHPMLSGINRECPQGKTPPANPEAWERKGLRSYFFLKSYMHKYNLRRGQFPAPQSSETWPFQSSGSGFKSAEVKVL